MKNRKIHYAKALTAAIAVLTSGAALAQMSITLPTTYAYPLSAANTNAPGFIWNINQSASAQPSSVAVAEGLLAGVDGPNVVDPTQIYSSAPADGTVPSNPNAPISFSIPGVINFSIAGPMDCSDNRSDLPCEDGMVGTPGTTTSQTQFAAEALTYLALPEGPTTIGVRSDDGFQLQIGAANPADRYSTNAVVVDVFNGTRGYADSIVTFNVARAGIYAARLLYFQNSGGASVELYTFPPAGGTNSVLMGPNTGTNAVLVNDLANGGIAAYQSLKVASLGSYVSSFLPTPGSIGVPIEPTITATIVNGSVPVTAITMTLDGNTVTPSVATTSSGATVTYTATAVLANIPTHTVVLSWNDNGTTLYLTSTFATQSYIALSASQVVTPDTTKPGFRFNIFANSTDPLVGNSEGIEGGETDNSDNIELGLNGLEPDGMGGILPNGVNVASVGAAMAPAPALGGPNAPAEFIVTNAINLNANNMPGFPASDSGSADPSHSEVLTYVRLPVGLTTFTLNLDGVYRAFMGSWDYINGVQVGTVNDLVSGNATFSVYAPVAGFYPLRLTVFNLDATPQESLYTVGSAGTNVLVGDVADGGLPIYYALSTPSSPYVRYASPRPVPRQVEYPNSRVLVRIQDGDIKLNDSSAVFNLDGKNVTVTNNRVGDVLSLTWTATTLQTPAEIHSGVLTYKDASGNSLSDQWSFLNLKAVWLPTASPGNWLPTNAVAIENWQEYADQTVFTNDVPTANWYTSPQPENPLVDVAPIWTNVPAGPTDWYVWNWDAAGDGMPFSATDPNSPAYANWFCVDLGTFSGIEGDSVNTAPFETINGVPLTQLIYDPTQNVFIAESDNRAGSSPGQTQFAMSKRFDLSSVTNPVIAFASIQKQNQDNINSMEYSIDGGATWAPIIYYLDGHEFGDPGDPADVQVNPDNTVNVNKTLFHDTNPGEIPTWTDSTGDVNSTFASCIGAPVSQALAPFFAPRINDNKYDGKRIEVVRLPLAANQSNVRLRVGQIGTCSWYFGLGQIAFYDVAPSGAIVPTGIPAPSGPTLSVTVVSGQVNVTWTGTGTLQAATALTGKPSDWSAVTPAPTGNAYSTKVGTGNLFFRLMSN